MHTPGGELAFNLSIIADSLVLKDSIRWYTVMVGKKSSLKVLRKVLLDEGVCRQQIRSSTLVQGKTHRWCLAWSFSKFYSRRKKRRGIRRAELRETSLDKNNPV